MKGSIAQLWRGRLCGIIRARDGQDVFFHARDLQDVNYNDLEVRGTVLFELIADAVSGPRAVRVRVAKRSS